MSRANGGSQDQREAGRGGRLVPSRSSSRPRPVTREPPALGGPVMCSVSQVGSRVGNAHWPVARWQPSSWAISLRVLWAGERSWVQPGPRTPSGPGGDQAQPPRQRGPRAGAARALGMPRALSSSAHSRGPSRSLQERAPEPSSWAAELGLREGEQLVAGDPVQGTGGSPA